ncbi:protein G-related alpha 2M-binding protein [Trichinella spiralis]|uniref:protein G-related alpha 2M-binding protein n=1 Tax=Trichinella spiralis TaxID=6334 RepID=UPI0001EFCE34|nr:protein G-related alpha 2M-binding protein [Trichinella spiralis]
MYSIWLSKGELYVIVVAVSARVLVSIISSVDFTIQGMRVCHGKLYSNLAATQVIRTSEHADGRQLNELRRLAVQDPRPVTEVYDELPSNASTILDTPLAFQLEGRPGTMYNRRSRRYPRHPARRQDLRLTAEQTRTNSGAHFKCIIC